MELSRLIRIVRGRWIGVVVAAVLGLLVAFVMTNRRNDQRTPEFVATVALVFTQDPFVTSVEDLAATIEEAQLAAIDVNRETLAQFPQAVVTFDTVLGELYFTAAGVSEETALAQAREMRDAFVASEESATSEVVTEQLADIANRIAPLQQELVELEQVPDEVLFDQATTSYLSRQIAALESVATDLRIEIIPGFSERDPLIIREELAAVEREIDSLNRLVVAIPAEDPLETAVRDLQIKAVGRRIQLLEIQYQDLYLQQGTEGAVRLGRSTVVDATPTEASAGANSLLGLIAGAAISVGGLVIGDRTRPLVWQSGDVRSLPVLSQIPRRRPGEGSFVWYETASSEGRKSALQTLRGAIEGRIGSDVSSIGITGLSSAGSAVQPLAADLAVGMAVAGRSVLLIDADFEHPSELFEYSSTGPTLAGILAANVDDAEAFMTTVKSALQDTPEVRPGLVVIRPGEGPDDPADALAGRQLRLLISEAEDTFDMIIVAAPEVRTPTGQTLLQRVDYAVLAVSPGGASVAVADSVVDDLTRRNVAFLGLVLLPRRKVDQLGSGVVSRVRETTRLGSVGAPETGQPVFAGRSELPRLRPERQHVGVRAPVVDREVVDNGEPVNIEFVNQSHIEFQTGVEDRFDDFGDAEDVDIRYAEDALVGAADEVSQPVDPDVPFVAGDEFISAEMTEGEPIESTTTTPEEIEFVQTVLGGMAGVPIPSEALEAGFETTPDKETLNRFLDALMRVDPVDVIDDVETMLTSWVTALVSTPMRTHHANRNSIVRFGFVPLFDIRGFSPIRARIRKEFDGPLGVRNARRLLVGIERILVAVAPEPVEERYSMNEWVIDRYWQRHVADTDREPLVWHLSSRHGTVQALIDWTRMDRDRIDLLRTEMVRQRIETLRRKSKTAALAGRSAEAVALDDQTKDARSFDLALGWLYDGTTPNARIWYPWRPAESPIGWRPNPRQGVKPHLAPVQRLELLAFSVLSDEEMMRLKPTG